MSKLLNRRNFLKAAAPLIAAPALLSNQDLFAAKTEKANLINPPLEVLYDTLGNATDGWKYAGQGGYNSTVANALGLNYSVVTCYRGTLSTAKRLRGFETASGAYNFLSMSYIPMTRFLNHMWLGIWRADTGTFYQQPIAPTSVGLPGASLTSINLGIPTTGDYLTPIFEGNRPVYVFGWDNLDVLLPANVGLEISLQFEESAALGDTGSIRGSFPWINQQLRASSSFGNATIGQPMACRITVSDIVTAANAEISGRVVNSFGRGIPRAMLTLQNSGSGTTVSAISNSFGYFRFTEQPAGETYLLSIAAKKYTFNPNVQVINLTSSINDLVFVGN